MSGTEPTRREVVRAALAGTALIAGAGAGTAVIAGVGIAHAQAAAGEADVLAGLLGVELLLTFAYRQALADAPLSPGVRRLTAMVLDQERAHADRLSTALARLGAALPAGPPTTASADQLIAMHPQVPGTLSSASTEHDWLRLLIGLEYVAEGSYYISTAKLTDAGHLRLAGEIMGSDAQHAAWLGQRLHRGDVSRSVPAAFVQGIP